MHKRARKHADMVIKSMSSLIKYVEQAKITYFQHVPSTLYLFMYIFIYTLSNDVFSVTQTV
jgi:hypothetical protein